MSSGASYLNSNVSLISKASIRYEGTLYSINPQEATITLSNVKSYGTEDRKVEKFLAPKDTLFEYIIFKANDIKELIVDEPLNDPAIVTATQMPSSSTASNNAFGFSSDSQQNQANGQSSEAQATLNGTSGNNQTSAPGVSSAGQGNDRFRSRGSTPSSSQARSPVSELSSNRQKTDLNKVMSRGNQGGNAGQSGGERNYNNNQRRDWDSNRMNNSNYQQRPNRYNNNNNNNNQMNRRPGGYQNNYHSNNFNRGAQGGYRRNDDRISSHLNNNRNGFRPNHHHNNNNNNGYQQNNRNNSMMRGNGRKFVPQSNKKFDATLKTEFDFEKANEVFQQMVDKLDDLDISANGEKSEKSGSEDAAKEENRTELEKDEDGNFYDKTKSFFDKISCEAIERTKGNQKRFDWKQERKLNAETFGLKITYRRNDGAFRRPGGFSMNNRNYNQNRNFQNNRNAPAQRMPFLGAHAPKTDSS